MAKMSDLYVSPPQPDGLETRHQNLS